MVYFSGDGADITDLQMLVEYSRGTYQVRIEEDDLFLTVFEWAEIDKIKQIKLKKAYQDCRENCKKDMFRLKVKSKKDTRKKFVFVRRR